MSPSPRLDPAGLAWALAAAGLWGTMSIAGKWLLGHEVAPLPLMAARATVAAVSLGLVLLLVGFLRWAGGRRRQAVGRPNPSGALPEHPLTLLRIPWRDLPFFALYGVVGVGLNYLAYFLALHYVGAILATTLFYTYPVMAALLAMVFLRERLTLRKALPLPLAFIGCALMAGLFGTAGLAPRPAGLVWGLVAALTFALYAILGRRAMARYAPWTALFYSIACGALFLDLLATGLCALTPAADFCGSLPDLSPQNLPFWGGLLYLALGPTLGGYFSYLQSLRRLEVRQASLLTTAELGVAVLLAGLVLREGLTLAQWIGLVLILSAVVWLRLERTH